MIVAPDPLRQWAADALHAVGAPRHTAARVADSLLESELRGYASHGLQRLPAYLRSMRDHTIDPHATPVIEGDDAPATLRIDGRRAFGQLSAAFAAEELIPRAHQYGVSAATIRRCGHTGRLGEYTGMLADAGLIGFATSNSEPWVSGPAGGPRLLGPNPLSWAVPGSPPVVVDFATSATAVGRVAGALARGEPLAAGMLRDRDGRPSEDPADLFTGGALRPAAGAKGFGLAVIADILGGILSGSRSGSDPDYDGSHGTFLLALDISAFLDPAEVIRQIEELRVRLAEAAADLPGARAARSRHAMLKTGIELPPATLENLDRIAAELGVARLPRMDTANGRP